MQNTNHDINNMNAIAGARHTDPFSVLGLHRDCDSEYLVIRSFQPFADAVSILDKSSQKELIKLKKIHVSGLFYGKLRRKKRFDYQLKITGNNDSVIVDDAFAFAPTLSETDIHLLNEGNHQKPNEKLGAHVKTIKGVDISTTGNKFTSTLSREEMNDAVSRIMETHNIRLKIK